MFLTALRLLALPVEVAEKVCGGSEREKEELEKLGRSSLTVLPAGHTNGYNTTSEVAHTKACVSVPGRTVVNRMESSWKNTQTGWLLFFFFIIIKWKARREDGAAVEASEIRTTLPLISLARRDFEQGAPSDKLPRINQATGDPPSPLVPPGSALPLAKSFTLKLLLACSWNAALSQSGQSNCCSHWESPTPNTSPLLLHSCYGCCCSGRLWCDRVLAGWLSNTSGSTAVFHFPGKISWNYVSFSVFYDLLT